MSSFDDPFWTPAQAVAWVAFKDRALVAATSSTALRELRYTDRHGNQRVRRDALEEHLYRHHPTSEIKVVFRRALEELQNALLNGEIVASYMPEGSTQRVEASELHWIDHHFYRSGALSPLASYSRWPHNPEIRFNALQIKRRWPAASTHAAKKRTAKQAAYDALYAMMKDSPHKRPKPKDKILLELMDKIPGLSMRAAEDQWVQAVKDAGADPWTWPGRPANDL